MYTGSTLRWMKTDILGNTESYIFRGIHSSKSRKTIRLLSPANSDPSTSLPSWRRFYGSWKCRTKMGKPISPLIRHIGLVYCLCCASRWQCLLYSIITNYIIIKFSYWSSKFLNMSKRYFNSSHFNLLAQFFLPPHVELKPPLLYFKNLYYNVNRTHRTHVRYKTLNGSCKYAGSKVVQ